MTSNSVNLVIAAAMVGANGITYPLFSGNQTDSKNWTNTADKHWWNRDVMPDYALTEKQAAELNKVRAMSNEKKASIQRKLLKLRNEFEGLDASIKSDRKNLRAYKVRIWNLEDEIRDINKNIEMQISKILQGKQLTFFNNSGYGWWSKVDRTWSSYEEKMLAANQKMRMSDRGFSW